MQKSNRSFITIGPTQLLVFIFVTLKLAHVIAWSWWWVLSPIWIPLAILGLVLIVLGLLALVVK